MIRAMAGAALLLLAACASTEQPTGRDLERLGRDYERGGTSPLAERPPGEDTCNARAHAARIGTPIAGWEPPAGSRVIRPGDAVTEDLRRNRLNVLLDANDRITALECY
jgi:hypothetical protein